MYEFTETELVFWRELTAPFADDAYRWREGPKGAKFTYVKKRTLENRLDDVVGPPNWTSTLVATDKGVICELTIIYPKGNGAFGSVSRPGLGSWADLNGDTDSEFKSAGTSAFVIACAAFGITRDLYDEGMPDYWASKFGGFASGVPMQQLPGGAPKPGECKQGEQSHSPPPSGNNGSGGRREYGNEPPLGKTGKAVFAWSKKMSDLFGIDVLGRMTEYAKNNNEAVYTDRWSQEFTDDCLNKTVEWLKTLSNYGGEFGHADVPAKPPAAAVAAAIVNSGPSGFPDLAAQKKSIAAAAGELFFKRLGRAPNNSETFALIGEIGASVPNSKGHRGEVLESLKGCEDAKWLSGILAAAKQLIVDEAKLSAAAQPEDDIPF